MTGEFVYVRPGQAGGWLITYSGIEGVECEAAASERKAKKLAEQLFNVTSWRHSQRVKGWWGTVTDGDTEKAVEGGA